VFLPFKYRNKTSFTTPSLTELGQCILISTTPYFYAQSNTYRDRVVVSLSALPDPNEVNYDLLLSCVYQTCCPDYHLFKRSSSRVLTYLNLYGMISGQIHIILLLMPTRQSNLIILLCYSLRAEDIHHRGIGCGRPIVDSVENIVRT